MINTTFMEMIPKSEYDKIFYENIRLKQRESELTGQLIDLQLKVNIQKITIEELTQQNEMLREKIKNLEASVLDLKTEIVNLKNDKIISKLMVVIQDLNAIDSLETELPAFAKKLSRFRKRRNGEFHFIMKESDTELDIQEKKYIIKIFLNKLNEETISIFEKNNNVVGLISYLKKYLKNSHDVILDSDKHEDLDIKNDMIQFFGNLTTNDLYSED
jgi:hypothetical protein